MKILFSLSLSFLLISANAQHAKLFDFNGIDGSEPWGSLISDGTFLYGMTSEGGVNTDGVIFKILPDGSGYVKLFDFEAATSGSFAPGSLVYDGTFLYGMTTVGGANNLGTIFKIRSDGTGFLKLLDFAGTTNGARPEGSLFTDGTFLYGMTSAGGVNNLGTIFKILPDGTGFLKLLDFNGTANGSAPSGSLISDGTFLYGMTSAGGSGNEGTIFKIQKDGSGYVRMLNFNGASNGSNPFGTLLYDGTFLYGMTFSGGTSNDGTIFKIRTDGTGYVRMFNFNLSIGDRPFGDLVSDGTFLYGLTYSGGSGGTGNLFKIKPDGTGFAQLHDFSAVADGWLPYGSPLRIGSTLYGMTQFGGTAGGDGTIFSYQLPAVPQNFITQWNLATAGSGATQLSFGTATSGTVNYTWQEISPGSASGSGSWNGTSVTITGLPTGATIRLQIAPTNFQRIIINTGADRNRLRQVEQWGTTAWTSMQNAFRGCVNLQVTATDVPDLSGLSDMSGMFSLCSTLNSPSNIGSWNTSAVTNMSGLFSQASTFNQNISAWNTGAVTNMSGLFADAASFNQDIAVWNTASVTNMEAMFAGAVVFNRNIGSWNTAAVTDMSAMFYSAYVFNQNISGWNTAAVTNMSSMFGYARDFNQNISTWNTSAVMNMSRMFEDAFDFNQNIGTWNTSAVTNMRGMFIDAYAFNQNIGTWNTSAVTDMSRMFDFATAFNQNIGAWNTAAVTDMSGMFADASDFNQNIGTWTLNSGVNLTAMLNNSNMDCSNYSATLIGWSTNPATPNGKTLGATGRQYGTNAAADRTNLTTTKGWTITGDTASGVDCGSASVPTITGFTPSTGPVGTTVIITGTNFDTTPANNTVTLNGTTAVVTASTATSITITVPAGATTGKISVTVAGNTATSTTDFTVLTATNQPPVIETTTTAVPIEGIVTLDLESLISDPDNNLDPTSLYLVNSVSEQGASATLEDGTFMVTLDYGGIQFFGTDRVTVGVCDLAAECAEQELTIEVGGDVVVYNAVSPDGNGLNDIFLLQYIDVLPGAASNRVSIFNRWGDVVFEISDYNNTSRVFSGLNKNGKELPSGTYFYRIEFGGGRKTQTGYLSLKR